MDQISKRYVWIFFIVLLTIMAAAYLLNIFRTQPTPKPTIPKTVSEETTAGYYTVRDANGITILQTGLTVRIDDRFINENNVQYVIIKVEGKNAVAEIIPKKTTKTETSISTSSAATIAPPSAAPAAASPRHVVIYSTHTDESYIPTSGTATKPGKGDIFQVASALTDTLSKGGISVTHSFARHDPHDINAYHRSRRTATQLLKERPDAAFDIHRDSAPANAYLTNINGIDSSRVMIVIGQSNPNIQTNLKFAQRVKSEADRLYPGMIRGIYMGKGDYNQDLYPTALLFEVGTEEISLDLAEKAVRCLGDVILRVL